MQLPYNFIAIEGNIGAGKTTLAKQLSRKLNARLMLEEYAENPYLAPFYDDPEKNAFHLELSFLAARYQQLISVEKSGDLFHPLLISDYWIGKCSVFAANNLEAHQYRLFRNFYELVCKSVPKPEAVIYISGSAAMLQERIAARGRAYESEIRNEYLNAIDMKYRQLMRTAGNMVFLELDGHRLKKNESGHMNALIQALKIKRIPGHYLLNIR